MFTLLRKVISFSTPTSLVLLPMPEDAVSHNGCCIWHDAKCRQNMDQDTWLRCSVLLPADPAVSISQGHGTLVEFLYVLKTLLGYKNK